MNEKQSLDETHIDELLWQMLQRQAHLLRLEAGAPPRVWRDGEMESHDLDEYEICKPQHIQSMIYDIISDEQISRFESNLRLSFEHRVMTPEPGGARFLVLVERVRGNVAATLRRVLG